MQSWMKDTELELKKDLKDGVEKVLKASDYAPQIKAEVKCQDDSKDMLYLLVGSVGSITGDDLRGIVKIIGSESLFCVQASEDDKAIDAIFLLDPAQVVPLKVSEKPEGSEALRHRPTEPRGSTQPLIRQEKEFDERDAAESLRGDSRAFSLRNSPREPSEGFPRVSAPFKLRDDCYALSEPQRTSTGKAYNQVTKDARPNRSHGAYEGYPSGRVEVRGAISEIVFMRLQMDKKIIVAQPKTLQEDTKKDKGKDSEDEEWDGDSGPE